MLNPEMLPRLQQLLADADLDFDATVFPIHPQQRQGAALDGRGGREFENLPLVQQQSARAFGVTTSSVSKLIMPFSTVISLASLLRVDDDSVFVAARSSSKCRVRIFPSDWIRWRVM